MRTTIRYTVPAEIEPRIESWLERREIPFEVSTSGRKGKLVVHADFGVIADLKERARLEEMLGTMIQKIKGGVK